MEISTNHFKSFVDWNTSGIVFSIDGTVVVTHSISITGQSRPLVSDYVPGGGAITLQSLQIIPSLSPFDFSISNSGDQSVTAGSSTTNTIATSLISGSSQPISFAVAGLPSGATASFSQSG